jgi:hypothetical protein
MDNLFSTFLLLLAVIVALLTYLIIPLMPVAVLTSAAAVALAGGVWWHWTQFAVDYRTSTWQEQLRGYASYALLLVVILLSYAFYAFALSGGSVEQLTASARNVSRRAVNSGLSRIASVASAASGGGASAVNLPPAESVTANRNRSVNFTF